MWDGHSCATVMLYAGYSLSEKPGMVLPENLLPGGCVEKVLEEC